MRNLIFAMLLLSACKDSEPPAFDPFDASQVAGFWHREGQVQWSYHFSDGLLTRSVFDFNAEIINDKFAYKTSRDTLKMFDLSSGQERVWTLYFFDENNFESRDTDPTGFSHRFTRY